MENSVSNKKQKQLIINIIASFVAFAVNMGINFFLSKYIVKNVGSEAYGFVQLANNLLTYFTILTIALNTMSSRFISVELFKGEIDEANGYFSSTFFANLFLVIILFPIIVFGIIFLEKIIKISPNLVVDVKVLMIFMAIDFIISLLCTNLSISYYVKNKLYISSMISIASYVIRATLLFGLFACFKANIIFIGLVTLIITCFNQAMNIFYKKKMIPNLVIKKKYFHISKVKEMLSSGIWNTITRVGSLLQEGLDLLITNIFISPADMGVLAIAKIVPNTINNILNTLISTFLPEITELYAKEQYDELVNAIKRSMNIIGMIINIPIAILIAYGDVLFSLWFPNQDAKLIQLLSIITIFPWAIMGQATIIHNVFTVLNKIKTNSILVCITGMLNVGIVFVLLKTTSLGLFAVAGVSTILSIVRNLAYTVPYGAKYVGKKWYTFFPEILKSVSCVIIISIVGYLIRLFMIKKSWSMLFIFALITTIIGFLLNYFIVLNKRDRKYLKNRINSYIKKIRK